MSEARPTIDQERRLRFAGRAKAWQRQGFISAEEESRIAALRPHWRESGVRIVLFVLTLIALAALNTLFDGMSGAVLVGLSACGGSELLIRRKRFLHVGPEEALFLGGLVGMIFALPGPSRAEGYLLFALAFFAAGWRLLNPVFASAGVVFVAIYLLSSLHEHRTSFLFCLLVTLAAAMASGRLLRRPWVDRTASLLLIAMPLGALLIARAAERQPNVKASAAFAVELAVLGLAGCALSAWGVVKRNRGGLVAGLLVSSAVSAQASFYLPLRGEAILLGWGLLLLIATATLHRMLRGKTVGITVQAMENRLADTALLASPLLMTHGQPASPERPNEGASFGGAGSSGDYE